MANKNLENNPFYRRPYKPSYLRRSYNHDYRWPGKYMVTLHKADAMPSLSEICGNVRKRDLSDSNAPRSIPSEAGMVFYEALNKWCKQYPIIQVDAMAIMPDHIHLCLHIKYYLKIGLSRAMANLMGKATNAFNLYLIDKKNIKRGNQDNAFENNDNSDDNKDFITGNIDKNLLKFFAKGFNDSIAYTDEQYEIQKNYILDNPRRLLMKRAYPDIYRKRWIIKAGNIEMMAIGNIYLLKNPHLQVVRYSRRFTDFQKAENHKAWERCIENGGALISPFIHPNEKEMRDEAIDCGGNIIRICENGFSERFSPAKTEFDLMGTRRLLLIAPMEYESQKRELSYNYAQELNSIAEFFASHPAGMQIKAAK